MTNLKSYWLLKKDGLHGVQHLLDGGSRFTVPKRRISEGNLGTYNPQRIIFTRYYVAK
jgi:hypothetical protein